MQLRSYWLFLVVLACASVRADFDSGLTAYKSGDFETAFKEFKVLAEADIVIAQTNLGYMYTLGEGVSKDLEQAAYWFKRAAENGSTAAQYTMGAMTFHGEGMRADPVQAYAWFSVASAGGQTSADDFITLLTTTLSSEDLTKARILSESFYAKFGIHRSVGLGDPG